MPSEPVAFIAEEHGEELAVGRPLGMIGGPFAFRPGCDDADRSFPRQAIYGLRCEA
jgi:hypothetical protein